MFAHTGTLPQAISSLLGELSNAAQRYAAGALDLADPNASHRTEELTPDDPHTSARRFLADLKGDLEIIPLVSDYARPGRFELFFKGLYHELPTQRLRALFEGYCRLPAVFERDGESTVQPPVRAGSKFTREVLDQIELLCGFDRSPAAGLEWREKRESDPQVGDLIVCANGVVDTRTSTLLPSTPRLYATSASDVVFNPDAGEPVETFRFLNEIFGGDGAQIDTYFEFMGEVLSGTNATQKALMLKGPTRSGKTTCVELIKAVMPRDKAVSKCVVDLAKPFGQQSLVGKQLCVFEDVRTVTKKGMERLLSLIAGDAVSVAKKYKDDFVGVLPLKCALVTNETLDADSSTDAFIARLVALKTTKSFADAKDTGLLGNLLQERVQILLKAIDGYRRLRARGDYAQPASSASVLEDINEFSGEIPEFMEDCVEVGDGFVEDRAVLYESYLIWAERERLKARNPEEFRKLLLACCDTAKAEKQRRAQDPVQTDLRVRAISGLRLKAEALHELESERWHRYSFAKDGTMQLVRTRMEANDRVNA